MGQTCAGRGGALCRSGSVRSHDGPITRALAASRSYAGLWRPAAPVACRVYGALLCGPRSCAWSAWRSFNSFRTSCSLSSRSFSPSSIHSFCRARSTAQRVGLSQASTARAHSAAIAQASTVICTLPLHRWSLQLGALSRERAPGGSRPSGATRTRVGSSATIGAQSRVMVVGKSCRTRAVAHGS
jgi:hypothetical protein